MKSKWFHLKDNAVQLRKQGHSIRDIEKRLHIPRSTLSSWLKNVPLSTHHQAKLKQRWTEALIKARKKALLWHNKQKMERLALAENEAKKTLSVLDLHDKPILELALAFLYLGEGNKRSLGTTLGNSNPLIMRFFVASLRELYDIPLADFKCELHLRADQDPNSMRKYWSHILGIPETNFGKHSIDMRTMGTLTFEHYKGVCVIRCSRVAIQRKLMYIAESFCRQVAEK